MLYISINISRCWPPNFKNNPIIDIYGKSAIDWWYDYLFLLKNSLWKWLSKMAKIQEKNLFENIIVLIVFKGLNPTFSFHKQNHFQRVAYWCKNHSWIAGFFAVEGGRGDPPVFFHFFFELLKKPSVIDCSYVKWKEDSLTSIFNSLPGGRGKNRFRKTTF